MNAVLSSKLKLDVFQLHHYVRIIISLPHAWGDFASPSPPLWKEKALIVLFFRFLTWTKHSLGFFRELGWLLMGKKWKKVRPAGPSCLFWMMWKARNEVVFRKEPLSKQKMKPSFVDFVHWEGCKWNRDFFFCSSIAETTEKLYPCQMAYKKGLTVRTRLLIHVRAWANKRHEQLMFMPKKQIGSIFACT